MSKYRRYTSTDTLERTPELEVFWHWLDGGTGTQWKEAGGVLFWMCLNNQWAMTPPDFDWQHEDEPVRDGMMALGRGNWTLLYYDKRHMIAAPTLEELRTRHVTYLLTNDPDCTF